MNGYVRRYINGAIIRLDPAVVEDNNDDEDISNPEFDFNDLWDLPPQQENQLLTEQERLNAVPPHGGDEEELEFDDVCQALKDVDINVMREVRSEREGDTILHVIVNSLMILPNVTEHNDDCPCNYCRRRLEHSQSLLEIVFERLAQADMFYELMRQLNNSDITPLQAAKKSGYTLFIKVLNHFQGSLTAEAVNELLMMPEGNGRNVFIYLAQRNIWSLIEFLETFDDEQKLHLLELLNPDTINYLFENHPQKLEKIADNNKGVLLHPTDQGQRRLQLIEHAKSEIGRRRAFENQQTEQYFAYICNEIIELEAAEAAAADSAESVPAAKEEVARAEAAEAEASAEIIAVMEPVIQKILAAHEAGESIYTEAPAAAAAAVVAVPAEKRIAVESALKAKAEKTIARAEQNEHLRQCCMHRFLQILALPYDLQLPDHYAQQFNDLQTQLRENDNAHYLRLEHSWRLNDRAHLFELLQALIPPEMLRRGNIFIPGHLTSEQVFEILEQVRILHNFYLLPGRDLDDLF